MEAPEKIYLTRNFLNSTALNTTNDYHRKFMDGWYMSKEKDADVEYIRTDYAEKVFLRTVNAWLAEIHRVCDITDENGYQIGLEKLQTSLKKYMKGE